MDPKNKDFKEKETKPNSQEFPGYPQYPDDEDIYVKSKDLTSINPDDLDEIDTQKDILDVTNEDDSVEIHTGNDLDVPGSELDDQMEDVGSEDEENNYYSIGGDLHEDLEESKE